MKNHAVWIWTVLAAATLASGPAAAQGRIQELTPTNVNQLMGTPVGMQQAAPADEGLWFQETNAGILDSAIPFSHVRLRYDLGYTNRRPTRAEFFQSAAGLRPETNVNYQELSTYAEFAPFPWFSTFVETPVRSVDPEVNRNDYGFGDMNFGFKLTTWSSEEVIATILLRVHNPTAQRPGLGNDHWTIEPGLLANWRPYDNLQFEGEVRYYAPLGGGDLAGDVVRYGLGFSLGQRASSGPWIKPVVEAVGWSVLGGKEMTVSAPDAFTIQDAAGTTILNAYLGARFGVGEQMDFYAGYGRCFTGDAWHRDFFRVEMRLLY